MATYSLETIDDDPDGIIKISKNYGLNLVFKIPVHKANSELEKISELSHSGIYTLFNSRNIHISKQLYVGKVDSNENGCAFRNRITQHRRSDWWDTAIFMTSHLKNSINSTETNYLENQLYKIISNNKRFELLNRNTPFSGNLNLDLRNSLNAWIDENKIILRLINLNFLDKSDENQYGRVQDDFVDQEEDNLVGANIENASNNELPLYLKLISKNVDAKCIRTGRTYRLLRGSKISREIYQSLTPTLKSLRQQCASIINEDFVLTQDLEFTSSSSAAKFVVGYSISGEDAWKNEEGQTLNELKRL